MSAANLPSHHFSSCWRRWLDGYVVLLKLIVFLGSSVVAGSKAGTGFNQSKHHSIQRRNVSMSFLVPILLALLTYPFLQSRLCKGQYSFAKTYFGWGLLGTVALSTCIFWLLGPIFFQQDHGRGDRAISVTFRIWSFATTLYMIGVCMGLNHIRKRDDRPLFNLYIIMLIVCAALCFLSSLAAAPVYWCIYGVTAFIAYKIRTNQNSGASPKSRND